MRSRARVQHTCFECIIFQGAKRGGRKRMSTMRRVRRFMRVFVPVCKIHSCTVTLQKNYFYAAQTIKVTVPRRSSVLPRNEPLAPIFETLNRDGDIFPPWIFHRALDARKFSNLSAHQTMAGKFWATEFAEAK